jgi:hypothetical protein
MKWCHLVSFTHNPKPPSSRTWLSVGKISWHYRGLRGSVLNPGTCRAVVLWKTHHQINRIDYVGSRGPWVEVTMSHHFTKTIITDVGNRRVCDDVESTMLGDEITKSPWPLFEISYHLSPSAVRNRDVSVVHWTRHATTNGDSWSDYQPR